MELNKIIKDVISGIKACAKQASDAGTWTYYIGKGVQYNGETVDVALVYAYNKADDEVVLKLAHQPANSVMQCDYDIDWEFPDCANNFTEVGTPVSFIFSDRFPQKDIDKQIGNSIKWCLSWACEYGIKIKNL